MKSHRATVALAVIVLGSTAAFGQVQRQYVEYSAKFLCGVVDNTATIGAPVRPGIYDTSINIHNPQLPGGPGVTFAKKVVLSPPEGNDPIAPTPFHRDQLKPDFAQEVDCRIIRQLLGGTTAPFIEGFVVLITLPPPGTPTPLHELDVVGVYTVTAPPTTQQSISLEIVPVAPRFINVPLPTATKMEEQLGGTAKAQ